MEQQLSQSNAKSNYSVQSSDVPVDNKPIPSLAYFSQRFEAELLRQKDLISGIQSKLNYIIDKRVPEKEDERLATSSDDLMGQLNIGIAKLEINNYQLEKILNHLSEII